MSDGLIKRLNFSQSDLSDCAEALDIDQRYCEARVVRWTAARIRELETLLDECEQLIRVGVDVTDDDFAEGVGRWRDDARATLSRLRAQEKGR